MDIRKAKHYILNETTEIATPGAFALRLPEHRNNGKEEINHERKEIKRPQILRFQDETHRYG